MPKNDDLSTKLPEESVSALHAHAKKLFERALYLIDGKKPPETPQHAIAIIINGVRARAHITRASCTLDDRIVCWATATPENSQNTRYRVNLTLRNGHWHISVKSSFEFVDEEDLMELID